MIPAGIADHKESDLMKYIIDRFEGDIAVCEDEAQARIEIDRAKLPDKAREGSTISIDDSGAISLLDDKEREKRIGDKMKAAWG